MKRRENHDKIECPFCKVTGDVTSEIKKQKAGLSLGKLLTVGWTLGLAGGVHHKIKMTSFTCKNCRAKWSSA